MSTSYPKVYTREPSTCTQQVDGQCCKVKNLKASKEHLKLETPNPSCLVVCSQHGLYIVRRQLQVDACKFLLGVRTQASMRGLGR